MKFAFSYCFVLLLILACTPKKNKALVNNPTYAPDVEARIQKVIGNLQVETDLDNSFDSKTLADQMRHYHTPGVSIAVINDGKIEWARGFGIANEVTQAPVDIQTLFEAGSVSKPTFALAVMKLKENGVVDLDKDVNEYLKSWKVPTNGDWQPRISLRQLLSHTAGMTVHGFPGYLKSDPIPTVPQILNGESPSNTGAVKVNIVPGTTFRYAGGGTTIAQLTITDIVGRPFALMMREELFAPLKLVHSTYSQPLPDSLNAIASTGFPQNGKPIVGRFHVYPEMAAAGLWTNPTELAMLALEVQRALNGTSSFYKKETIEEMLTPQKAASRIGVGFFLQSKGDSARFSHGGWDEGFVTQLTAYKKLGKGAVIMVNSNEGNALLGEIMNAIALEYQWPDFFPARTKEVATSNEDVKKLPGTYADQNSKFKIEASGGQLYLSYQAQDPIKLSKKESGEFFNSQFNFTIQFEPGVLKFTQEGSTKSLKKE